MLLTIVLIVFALHVAAWLVLPATKQARAERAYAPTYRAATSSVGEPVEV